MCPLVRVADAKVGMEIENHTTARRMHVAMPGAAALRLHMEIRKQG